MFAVIDCGTTMTRIYIVDEDTLKIVASGRRKVGVRDTSITGSRDALRNGITELFFQILEENKIPDSSVFFSIASGMITSEVGLIDIPHLIAPVGLAQLSAGVVKVEDPEFCRWDGPHILCGEFGIIMPRTPMLTISGMWILCGARRCNVSASCGSAIFRFPVTL